MWEPMQTLRTVVYMGRLVNILPWWRHQMKTFSALLALCARNSLVTGEFPAQRPVTRSCEVFFDLRLNKRLSKQSWGWWFETPWRPLWRHCTGVIIPQFCLGYLDSYNAKYESLPTHFVLKGCIRDTNAGRTMYWKQIRRNKIVRVVKIIEINFFPHAD